MKFLFKIYHFGCSRLFVSVATVVAESRTKKKRLRLGVCFSSRSCRSFQRPVPRVSYGAEGLHFLGVGGTNQLPVKELVSLLARIADNVNEILGSRDFQGLGFAIGTINIATNRLKTAS